VNRRHFLAATGAAALQTGSRTFFPCMAGASQSHLHRHTFEITNFGGKLTGGVHKDVVLVNPFSTVEIDFVADNPGLTLFHCHAQLHMDFGFMNLIKYA
jgi:hypothetical protein